MTILHDAVGCRSCQAVRERVGELGIAYRDEPRSVGERQAHTLVEDDLVFQGRLRIHDHVDELAEFARKWQRFQTDTCYLEE
ncbi:MAG: hypothetical protein BWX88_04650 [Planctomycetes bacterium ADurb.Bin126]|nr:MAG: hypothetical protein BWX88_04650 [Planctomycetes bacterium ADurb.Bin126]HOD84090.1 hypothetical protein [Phycisphaerae bacterium]HQL75442.1 hypothetical protein [Phycisphaerae bacterium]